VEGSLGQGAATTPTPEIRSRQERPSNQQPHEVRKRETRQPITRKPCSSPADSRGRPQLKPPKPWSRGARKPAVRAVGLTAGPRAPRVQRPHLQLGRDAASPDPEPDDQSPLLVPLP